ncbi:3-oxoacid CoA-transferase subunit A [Diaminobutyricimonas sp. LJ205]|uniref:3-oxoacid CoA-transferase subunit A n=1 Tax=Diaminobutyricimonas sp. LJ205 TaxID=2683590 RepID=UPI0012F494BD|nr:3-oxoacid CoA-transferase subunit A [Diaminobutyricimonas sp. LJ205]
MIDKVVADADAAVADIADGATLLVGGFGPPGLPTILIEALVRQGAKDLVIVNNNAAAGGAAMADLFGKRRVRKVICSFPKAPDSTIFEELFLAGELELELLPQGTLAERIRAAGAGLGGFLTPTGYGTQLAEGKETRIIDGIGYVFEEPLPGDVALIKAHKADRSGNLVYQKTARNFGPIMATAAGLTLVEASAIVERGELDPEVIVTPGIYVDRVINAGLSEGREVAA